MKPKSFKKAARKIQPHMVDRLVKHLGGKPMTRKSKFGSVAFPPTKQPKA